MTETCHLESLRKQREIDRYHQSTNKQSCSLTDDSKSTQKVGVYFRGKTTSKLPQLSLLSSEIGTTFCCRGSRSNHAIGGSRLVPPSVHERQSGQDEPKVHGK